MTTPAPPPLAGLCTRAEATRIGYSVEEGVARLVRYHWVEKRLFEIAVARLPGTPEWEVKGALALHQWQAAEHADALRRRVGEMRSPPPPLDRAPAPPLEAFLAEVGAAADTLELLVGLYRVAHGALMDAYRQYLERSNPLVDHPTRRVLRFALAEEEETVAWGEAAIEALASADDGAADRAREWEAHLRRWLAAAGGIAGDEARPAQAPPPARAPSAPAPSMEPRRDAHNRGTWNFNFPPQNLYLAAHIPPEERNLALLCKRLLEMDVPEMMASFLTERRDRPWGFYLEYARQLWDEARHAMMGEVALDARGLDWRAVPRNVSFSLRLNLHADPLERQLVLWAIEQGLMPADTGKRYEWETALAAGDQLSAHFQDYDWADEVLHAQIGRRWIRAEGLTLEEADRRAKAVNERTWDALGRYRDREPQAEWWSAFVRAALGRDTAARPEELEEAPRALSE